MKNKKALLPISVFILAIISYIVLQGNGFWQLTSHLSSKINIDSQQIGTDNSAYFQPKRINPANQPSAEMLTYPATGRDMVYDQMGSIMPPYPVYNNDALDVDQRVYEKRSYHYVLVKDVAGYLQKIREYALSINGRILSSSANSNAGYESGYLSIKVPVAKFEEATSRATSDVKKVLQESISAYDKTGELVGNNEQLAKLQDTKLQKQIDLEQAKTELERRRIQLEINRLDQQIAQAEKQLANTEKSVEYATLEISATNQEPYYSGNDLNPWQEMKRAWQSMWGVLMLVLSIAVWLAVYGLVWLPVLLIAKWVIKKIKR